MAFTGVLGRSSSQLGDLQLGIVGGNPSDSPSVVQNLTITQALSYIAVFNLVVSHSLSFTQLAELGVSFTSQFATANSELSYIELGYAEASPTMAVFNELVLSQSVSVIHGSDVVASNALAFTSSAIGVSPKQHGDATLNLVAVVNVVVTSSRSLSNALTFIEVAESEVLRIASSALTFTQSSSTTIGKGASDVLALTQSLSVNLTPHNDSMSNSLTIIGAVTEHAVFNRAITHTLAFTQTSATLISKDVTATNLFVVTDNAAGYKVTFASNAITFSNTSAVNKVIDVSVTDTLSLQQATSINFTLNLTPTSTLTFLHTYLRPTMVGGVFQLMPIPEVIITKVIDRVSFRTRDRAIILRPPLLNDGEAGNGKIVLQRTITGGTYVYARRVTTRSLKYTFETDSFKAFEMRRFALDCLSEPIWLENWKGEIWVGYFMNNPFIFTARGTASPCGDWHSFDVEFEGERIH